MLIEELVEMSDVEKWEWAMINIPLLTLVDDDEDEVYFVVNDPTGSFELHFNEPMDANESLNNLLAAIGFESHNY